MVIYTKRLGWPKIRTYVYLDNNQLFLIIYVWSNQPRHPPTNHRKQHFHQPMQPLLQPMQPARQVLHTGQSISHSQLKIKFQLSDICEKFTSNSVGFLEFKNIGVCYLYYLGTEV